MRTLALFALVAAAPSVCEAQAKSPALIVHEWGTFTSFQDANGATISGINVDDEPVPKFVHRLMERQNFTTRSTPALWSQGAPRCHPDVTLRLETPVLYFYPQGGFSAPLKVQASFVGGWLTEFYPFADVENSGFPGALTRESRGSLQWKSLQLSTNTERLPSTTEHVWLAPRAVHSAVVTEARSGQAEKYLFYRGVGHVDAPLIVREQGNLLSINRRPDLKPFPQLWVVRVQPDGRVRYRAMPVGEQGAVGVTIPAVDTSAPSNREDLYRELGDALVKEGLYREEALAMLETWELSYFESEGIRVMFILPRSWTDAQLPLSISAPADITRVMMGRIELTSPYQRSKLRRLLELPATAFDRTPLYAQNPSVIRNMQSGAASHADLYRSIGREVPESLQLYDQLGRFRDALLVHEWNSTRDEATRGRIKLIMQTFSACIPAFAER